MELDPRNIIINQGYTENTLQHVSYWNKQEYSLDYMCTQYSQAKH